MKGLAVMEYRTIDLRERPPGDDPLPSFFYTNFSYREAFATVRYGIEARKGLIVVTGAGGIGKTTLLHKLLRELETDVQCVLISNPRFELTELLRDIFRHLALAPAENDSRLSMIHKFERYLLEQFENGRIVTLLIDDAQNQSDQVLEYLIGLMLLCELKDHKEKLLQLVLVGRPELETKLDQPRLRVLKRHVALMCTLSPLRAEEVRLYIDARIQTVGLGGKNLFHPSAIEEIAAYSHGIPRLINTLCDSVLQMARQSGREQASAGMVRETARELELDAPGKTESKKSAMPYEITTENKNPPLAQAVGQTDSNFTSQPAPHSNGSLRTSPLGHGAAVVKIALALVVLGSAGAAVVSEPLGRYLSDWNARLRTGVDIDAQYLRQTKQKGYGTQKKRVPGQNPALLTENKQTDNSHLPKTKPSTGPDEIPSVGNSHFDANATNSSVEAPPVSASPDPIREPEDPYIQRQRIEINIRRAIENRAIGGIEVSLIRGTAYLDGRVATERQKLAAERAAATIPGVERVLNRIVVR